MAVDISNWRASGIYSSDKIQAARLPRLADHPATPDPTA
jgi:hypothetical protein